jgi:hypothetical protein
MGSSIKKYKINILLHTLARLLEPRFLILGLNSPLKKKGGKSGALL